MVIPALIDVCDRSGGQFPCENWETEFGPFCFFRLIGYRQIAMRSGIPLAVTIKQSVHAGLKLVPAAWKQVLPGGEWAKLAGPQIDHALNGDGMRFDKAALAVLALHASIQNNDELDDKEAALEGLYRDIKIAPALFTVEGFTRAHVAEHGVRMAQALLASDKPTAFMDMTLAEAALPVTYRLATAVAEWLKANADGDFRVVRISTRDELPKGMRKIGSHDRVRLGMPNDDVEQAAGDDD